MYAEFGSDFLLPGSAIIAGHRKKLLDFPAIRRHTSRRYETTSKNSHVGGLECSLWKIGSLDHGVRFEFMATQKVLI